MGKLMKNIFSTTVSVGQNADCDIPAVVQC
uniref:Uncharacterized protein n=1 Tax=Anguilla anguilla TaxID=7936 RepID=A0A0E9QUA2_ANGAN